MPRQRNRRRLTEAERDARRQADRERVEQAARALLTSDGWQHWIRVRATNGLSRYSLRNQWLIACECHVRGITPTYVAGFRAFLALNRCVRKGETAMRILAPFAVKQRDDAGEETGEKRIFFRTVPVFDKTLSRDLLRGVVGRCGRSFEPRGLELGNAPAAAALVARCGSAVARAPAPRSAVANRGLR
jgi:N-terminal domain of anti-restriction factor ArdC